MAWNSNWFIKEHVLENRTSGVVTSLTIKLAAYAKDTMTKVTGDGSNFITHTDCTWKTHTVSGNQYYAYDNYTELATRSYTYTVPGLDYIVDETDSDNILMENDDILIPELRDQQTDIVQGTHSATTDADSTTYRNKRKVWSASYKDSPNANTAYGLLLDDLGQ